MSDEDFGFENMEEMLKAFNRMKIIVLEELGWIFAKEIKKLTPVDTSRLKDSIEPNVLSSEEVEIGTNVHYAPHVEYGHLVVRYGRPVGYKKGVFMFKKGQIYALPKAEKHVNDFYEFLDKNFLQD